jgi:hypothetical protein
MKFRKSLLLIITLLLGSWVIADINVSGTLHNQYGKTISDAEIFINDLHVIKPNSNGTFSVQINNDIKSITIRSFNFYTHKIKANFTEKKLELGEIHLIPRLLWTDKSIKIYSEKSTDYGKFSHKKFEGTSKNRRPRYKRWIINGRSKFYNTEGKLTTTLKFKEGVLVVYRRTSRLKYHRYTVVMNDKQEIILDLTS